MLTLHERSGPRSVSDCDIQRPKVLPPLLFRSVAVVAVSNTIRTLLQKHRGLLADIFTYNIRGVEGTGSGRDGGYVKSSNTHPSAGPSVCVLSTIVASL